MKHLLCTTAIAAALMTTGGMAQAAGSDNANNPNKASDQQKMASMSCERTFAKVDANGDGIISTKEASNASGKEFDRLDTDKSGAISKDEWQKCGDMASINQMDKMPLNTDQEFKAADQDKNNKVTKEEAAKSAENTYKQNSGSGQSAEEAARNYGARFAMIDTNGDGAISKDEWDNRDKAKVDTAFGNLDKDDNGKLSKSEYQEARNASQNNGKPVTVWYYFIY